MNKSLMTGIGVGIVVAAAAGAVANLSMKGDSARGAAIEEPMPREQVAASDAADAAVLDDRAAPDPAAGSATEPVAPIAAGSKAPRAADRSPARSAGGAAAFAKVVASTPVIETEKVAREVCRDEQVVRQKPVQDEKRVAGAALGAIVGGVLGNQVGDGDGQKIATAAGAIAGGVAGSKIQKRVQQGNTETVTERRCETVYDMKEKTVGWDVRYRIGDQVQTVRMESDPGVGAQLPLRNGRLTAQTAGKDRGTT